MDGDFGVVEFDISDLRKTKNLGMKQSNTGAEEWPKMVKPF